MAGRIIATAQQKGGAGKTTLAAHLAVAAAEMGLSVLAIDIDPQGSLAAWGALRAEREPRLKVTVESAAGHRVRDYAGRRAGQYDLIVIDAPPHAETETRQALRAADLILAPIQPSPLDLWATRSVVEAARAANTPIALVMNKVPARAKIVEAVAEAAAKEGAAVLASRLGARVVFAEAMGEGLTAMEKAPGGAAAAEARALAREALALR